MKELGAYNFFVDRGGLLYASAQLIPFLKLIIENITATLASSLQDLRTAENLNSVMKHNLQANAVIQDYWKLLVLDHWHSEHKTNSGCIEDKMSPLIILLHLIYQKLSNFYTANYLETVNDTCKTKSGDLRSLVEPKH